ncbi:polysaccharide deacetylase family protein [Rufibacter tibetensis]|uniref:Polysaccharide deacetylase n=1 Tax=Rufibacter tibetensis TaxID=512763 RepID=A0A0P0C1C4_9BACT|nr:polysaccharide deacetylase family protein [Rufibacter tibetensis]ALI98387.1 polysaccharide deacetylase [Rufibacter tibetensis]
MPFTFFGGRSLVIAALSISLFSCSTSEKTEEQQTTPSATPVVTASGKPQEPNTAPSEATAPETTSETPTLPATAETILARPQVPILCYHQIREWTSSDGKVGKDYIVKVADFKAQMKMLADSGYHTILPDQLQDYLTKGTPLPSKPIMLTFDDTKLDQYTVAKPELEKYGFKGVFFIMTVSIGRPNYMTKEQIKELSDAGHVIGSHTYDHHNVKKYEGKDWVTQIEKPTKQLEAITGKPIKYFAYPFGLWRPEAIPELKKRGFDAAYILATKRDPQDPLFTIRRIIASGYWSTKGLYNSIQNSF